MLREQDAKADGDQQHEHQVVVLQSEESSSADRDQPHCTAASGTTVATNWHVRARAMRRGTVRLEDCHSRSRYLAYKLQT